MAEVNVVTGNKRKKLDIDHLFSSHSDDEFDDRPPELIIVSSETSHFSGAGTENEYYEFRSKTNEQLNEEIRKTKLNISVYGSKLRDNGDKLKLTLRRLEAEFKRRKRIKGGGGGIKCEETIQLSDQSDNEGALWLKEKKDKKDKASSGFSRIFFGTLNQNDNKHVKTVNAFHEELSAVNPFKEKKVKQNGQFLSKPSPYHLMDGDIEEPDLFDTPYAENLSDWTMNVFHEESNANDLSEKSNTKNSQRSSRCKTCNRVFKT